MAKMKLSKDTQFMLYFFVALMKKKGRLLSGLDKLSDETKALAWFEELVSFVENNTVDFPEDEDEDKFALVHLPATNPPLTLMCLAISTPVVDFNYDFVLEQQVFAQLNLSQEVQDENKAKMKVFWEVTVGKTSHGANKKNFDKKKEEGKSFDEDIYKNQVNDKYMLLSKNFKSLKPANEEVGYTKEEILAWISLMTGVQKTDTEKKEEKKKEEKKGEKKEKGKDTKEDELQKAIDEAAQKFKKDQEEEEDE
jgi:hypothetical protein